MESGRTLNNTENTKALGMEKHFVWGYGRVYSKAKKNDSHLEFVKEDYVCFPDSCNQYKFVTANLDTWSIPHFSPC